MNIMTVSLNYLSQKGCSEKELRTHLEGKFEQTDQSLIEKERIIDQLKSEGLIDDARLAQSLALNNIHKGNRFIVDLLREKGISESIISITVSQLESEQGRALKEVQKRLANQWDSNEKTISFVFRFLRGRRFSHLTARLVVDQLCFTKPKQQAA